MFLLFINCIKAAGIYPYYLQYTFTYYLLSLPNPMCALTILFTADPNLGRVDYSSFTDQTLMEMLIEQMGDADKQEFHDEDGMFLEVCEWPCVQCDSSDRVIEIREGSFRSLLGSHSGSLQLSYIPPKVRKLSMSFQQFTGSIDLTCLSDSIEYLSLNFNRLTDSIELTKLPQQMQCLNLGDNRLCGSIDLKSLPESMVNLYLHSNQLTGSIDLIRLPENIRNLSICQNQLTGSLLLTHLPHGIIELYLEHNAFSGSVDLTNLPESLKYIFLNNNRLSGSVNLTALPAGMVKLNLHKNLLTGPFIATSLPETLTHLYAQENPFDAIAVVEARTTAHVNLSESGVTSVIDENGAPKVFRVRFTNNQESVLGRLWSGFTALF